MTVFAKRVLGLGTVVVDHQVFLKRLPDPDTKGEIIGDRFQVGGPVPTALALLSRWGWQASFVGKWSTDDWGNMVEEDLGRAGVDVGSALVHPAHRTGFAHVWVEQETGRRSIAAFRGSHQITEDDLDGVPWSDYAALHLDGWSTDAAIVAARAMREVGKCVFIDLGSPKPRLEDLLAWVDYVNCPLRLLERLYPGESVEVAAGHFLALGVRAVSVTDGERGAWLVTLEGALHQPAFSVAAVDTNGAGDVFSGAMLRAHLAEWDLAERLLFASAAAAHKCEGLGNRQALPSETDVMALRQRFG